MSLETALDALVDALEQLHSALAGAANGPGLAHSARAPQSPRHSPVSRTRRRSARSVGRDARGFTLSMLPFDIAPRFRAIVDARPCAWIFTSATLSLGDDFSHFAARLGLGDAATLRIESPFDFERQGLLYLPQDMPDPASSDYLAAVLGEALPLIEAARGGAFLLFTSHRALGRVADLIRARAEGPRESPILVQGTAPREQLRANSARRQCRAAGTASFWKAST